VRTAFPPAIAILIAIALYALLPTTLVLRPRFLIPGLEFIAGGVAGLPDLLAMSRTLHRRAQLLLGDPGGIEEIRAGHRDSIATGNHVFAIMGYVLLVQDLWDLGAFPDVARMVEEGLAYAHAREIDFYVEHPLPRRHRSCDAVLAPSKGDLRRCRGVKWGT
jgi:hypothetical protein